MKNQDQIPLYAGSPIAYSPKPVALSRAAYNSIESSLAQLLKQVEEFSTQVLTQRDRRLFETLGIPSDLDSTPTPMGLHIPFARFDFVLDRQNNLKVLELNTDGTSSWNVAEWVSEQGHLDGGQNPNKNLSLRLLEGIRAHNPKAPRVVLLDFDDVLTKWEQDDLVSKWSPIHPSLRGEPDQRSWQEGDLIYRRAVSWTLRERASKAEPFLTDWKSKKITVVGGWSSDIGMSKAWPAILKSPNTAETVFIENTQIKMLREERENWVIKAVMSHSGKGVMRGRDVSDEAWSQKLKVIQDKKTHVAQRLIEFGEGKDERIEWGMFFINSKPAGLMARTGHQGAITDQSSDLMRPVLIEG